MIQKSSNRKPFHVIYRTYPGYNKTKALLAFPDKSSLVELSLGSLASLLTSKDRLTIIIDSPSKAYISLIERILIPYNHLSIEVQINQLPYGNASSFRKCISVGKQSDFDIIFFCEDDYFLRHGCLDRIADLFSRNKLSVVFPFYHPSYQNLPIHKITRAFFKAVSFFRSKTYASSHRVISGCLTFAINRIDLYNFSDSFSLYGDGVLGDHNMWKSMTIPLLGFFTSTRESIKFPRLICSRILLIHLKNIFSCFSFISVYDSRNSAIHLSNDCLPSIYSALYAEACCDKFILLLKSS